MNSYKKCFFVSRGNNSVKNVVVVASIVDDTHCIDDVVDETVLVALSVTLLSFRVMFLWLFLESLVALEFLL